jgi:uncharacterized protein with GYD domain
MLFITLADVTTGGWEALKEGMPEECYQAVKEAYVVYGRTDIVLIWEAPDIETANRLMKHIAAAGAMKTETMVVASTLKDFLA